MVKIYDPIGNKKKIIYYTALFYSNVHAKGIRESHNYLEIKNYCIKQAYSFYYEPLNINVKTYVELYSTDMPFHFIELWNIPVKPIHVFYDHFTTKVILIQKWWRKVFIKRLIAKFVICKYIYRAWVNPYTPIGKNRLLRDFYKM